MKALPFSAFGAPDERHAVRRDCRAFFRINDLYRGAAKLVAQGGVFERDTNRLLAIIDETRNSA